MGNAEGTDDGTNQKTTEGNGTDGNSYKTHGNGREQAGMSREGRRTMEKVLENTVRDTNPALSRSYQNFVEYLRYILVIDLVILNIVDNSRTL